MTASIVRYRDRRPAVCRVCGVRIVQPPERVCPHCRDWRPPRPPLRGPTKHSDASTQPKPRTRLAMRMNLGDLGDSA